MPEIPTSRNKEKKGRSQTHTVRFFSPQIVRGTLVGDKRRGGEGRGGEKEKRENQLNGKNHMGRKVQFCGI